MSSDLARTPPASPVQKQTELVDPWTGGLVDCSDLAVAGEFVEALRQAKIHLDHLIEDAEAIALDQMAAMGQGTVRVGRVELERNSQVAYDWDLEELQKLLDAGLPAERYAELVVETVTHKVRQNVAKQIASINPRYAEIIDHARTAIEKPAKLSVRLGSEAA